MNSDWISHLRPGDEVFVESGAGTDLTKRLVAKVTKLHVVLSNGVKFRMSGIIVGERGGAWPAILREATTATIAKWRTQQALYKLRSTDFRMLSLPKLEKLAAVLDEDEK